MFASILYNVSCKVSAPCRTYCKYHSTVKQLHTAYIQHSNPHRYQLNISRYLHSTTVRLNKSEASEANAAEESEKPEIPESEKKLQEQLAKITEVRDSLDDKYKRSLAETENVRNRMQKQINDSKLYGIQGFCKDLLEVADLLGLATDSISQEKLDDNPQLKDLYSGLTMTSAQLQKVFGKHGLKPINPEGEKFNPNEHEALFQSVVPNKEAGVVCVVTKIGYKLHERTIRPALVGVTKSPD